MNHWLASFFNSIFSAYSYTELFLLTTLYFAFLYFGLGWLFWKTCRVMLRQGWAERISDRPYSREQLRFELRQSIFSILIFGFSAWPLKYLIALNIIQVRETTLLNTLWGLLVLTLWNEVHFYVIHRLMHGRFMMKHVHRIHHQSVVPSVFSVYSFHPVEAALLSGVLLVIAPFYDFSAAALMLFPTVSILINFSGHSNYRLVLKTRPRWLLFATKHNDHHGKAGQKFGFMTNFMDDLFTKTKK
jgi:sterol desaturase/sphingolipid hydroxylase (fatty acid hydroxylase superfamily)